MEKQKKDWTLLAIVLFSCLFTFNLSLSGVGFVMMFFASKQFLGIILWFAINLISVILFNYVMVKNAEED